MRDPDFPLQIRLHYRVDDHTPNWIQRLNFRPEVSGLAALLDPDYETGFKTVLLVRHTGAAWTAAPVPKTTVVS
jgi:hypothetical protein